MDTKILFELLLYIETLRKSTPETEAKKIYSSCRNLIISYYKERELIEKNYGKFEQLESEG